jgi:hypothetical protein
MRWSSASSPSPSARCVPKCSRASAASARLVEIGKRFREPVLVSGTDGVGTKLMLAFALDRHDTVGIDLVAMSVNDILVQGAEPLFFLDYFALRQSSCRRRGRGDQRDRHRMRTSRLRADRWRNRRDARHVTVRGTNTILPDSRSGVVEKSGIIDGRSIVPGDAVLGIASSGPHSNGFSLIRRSRRSERRRPSLAVRRTTIGGALLAPTRIYVKPVLALMHDMPGQGHGPYHRRRLLENVPRHAAAGMQARLSRSTWERPTIFDWLQRHGKWLTTKCIASSIAASAWSSWSPPSTPTARSSCSTAPANMHGAFGNIVAQPAGEASDPSSCNPMAGAFSHRAHLRLTS